MLARRLARTKASAFSKLRGSTVRGYISGGPCLGLVSLRALGVLSRLQALAAHLSCASTDAYRYEDNSGSDAASICACCLRRAQRAPGAQHLPTQSRSLTAVCALSCVRT